MLSNAHVLCYNLGNLWRIRKAAEPPITWHELRERVFSLRPDNHQPNLARFLLGTNRVFRMFSLGPHKLLRLLVYWKSVNEAYRLVQAAPKKGTVMLYRSDMLHAGPDNRSQKPRFFFSMSIARDVIFPEQWRLGYAPHASLLAKPVSLGDLLDRPE